MVICFSSCSSSYSSSRSKVSTATMLPASCHCSSTEIVVEMLDIILIFSVWSVHKSLRHEKSIMAAL
jgi:hypothetical protein